MKKTFLFILLFFSTLVLFSQQRSPIQTRIERVNDIELTWIKLTITNTGNDPLIINDMCRLSNQGSEIGQSVSYASAIAFDANGQQFGYSNKLNFISFDSNNGINLRKGESEVQVFLLKSVEIPGFYTKNFSEKNIKSLQLKVHLSYISFVPNGFLISTEDVLTNRISM